MSDAFMRSIRAPRVERGTAATWWSRPPGYLAATRTGARAAAARCPRHGRVRRRDLPEVGAQLRRGLRDVPEHVAQLLRDLCGTCGLHGPARVAEHLLDLVGDLAAFSREPERHVGQARAGPLAGVHGRLAGLLLVVSEVHD